jgi:hypothetical protein
MSWRTTAVLFVVLLLVGGYVYYQSQQELAVEPLPTPLPQPEQADLVAATIDEVNRLDVTRLEDAANASFSRNEAGDWFQTVPTNTEVISMTMNTQITGLASLRSSRTLPADANPLSTYGLDEPAYEIVLATTRDERTVRTTLLVGNETPAGDANYVQKRGDPRVHIVPIGVIQNVIGLLENPPLPEPTPTAAVEETPVLEETSTPTDQ